MGLMWEGQGGYLMSNSHRTHRSRSLNKVEVYEIKSNYEPKQFIEI